MGPICYRPFWLPVPQYPNHAPFPHPAHRTGQADFPHPALGQDFMLLPTENCASSAANKSDQVDHVGTDRDSVTIPCHELCVSYTTTDGAVA